MHREGAYETGFKMVKTGDMGTTPLASLGTCALLRPHSDWLALLAEPTGSGCTLIVARLGNAHPETSATPTEGPGTATGSAPSIGGSCAARVSTIDSIQGVTAAAVSDMGAAEGGEKTFGNSRGGQGTRAGVGEGRDAAFRLDPQSAVVKLESPGGPGPCLSTAGVDGAPQRGAAVCGAVRALENAGGSHSVCPQLDMVSDVEGCDPGGSLRGRPEVDGGGLAGLKAGAEAGVEAGRTDRIKDMVEDNGTGDGDPGVETGGADVSPPPLTAGGTEGTRRRIDGRALEEGKPEVEAGGTDSASPRVEGRALEEGKRGVEAGGTGGSRAGMDGSAGEMQMLLRLEVPEVTCAAWLPDGAGLVVASKGLVYAFQVLSRIFPLLLSFRFLPIFAAALPAGDSVSLVLRRCGTVC